MKKILSVALAVVLVLSAAILGIAEDTSGYRTGYAVVTTAAGSASASADAAGKAAMDVTIVGVLLDGDGKIADAAIDFIPASIGFTADGKISADTAAPVPTKQEIGFDYGMKNASSIDSEWFEQANALAEYVVGKTAEEVLAIEIGENRVTTDADLLSSVTIKIDGYIAAIYQACENAAALGAGAGDNISVAATTSISGSKDAADGADGSAAIYSMIAVVTANADGVVTSCVLDALQAAVTFDAAGQITSDTAADFPTKNMIGDAYGMKAASSLGLEWNEQAANFAALVVGKNLAEISGMDLAGADVVSGATISVDGLAEAVVKALS